MTLDDLASPEYRALLRTLHASAKWGGAGKSHAGLVTEFARVVGARTILDYGCGRDTLKDALGSEFETRSFDVGIESKDTLPEPADLVVATDVLEHVEPDRLDHVLDHVRELTLKGMFAIVALSLSKVSLPDGRNSHLIVKRADWWADVLKRRGFRIFRKEMRKGLWVWMR